MLLWPLKVYLHLTDCLPPAAQLSLRMSQSYYCDSKNVFNLFNLIYGLAVYTFFIQCLCPICPDLYFSFTWPIYNMVFALLPYSSASASNADIQLNITHLLLKYVLIMLCLCFWWNDCYFSQIKLCFSIKKWGSLRATPNFWAVCCFFLF